MKSEKRMTLIMIGSIVLILGIVLASYLLRFTLSLPVKGVLLLWTVSVCVYSIKYDKHNR